MTKRPSLAMGAFFMDKHVNQINVSRRTLLATLLKGAATAVAARYWTGLASADSTLALSVPVSVTDEVSFDMFYALSQLVTLRTHLDERVARRLYPLFIEEPWGAHHIRSTYAELRVALSQTDSTPGHAHPAASGQLGKGQAWFASHVLTTWYLGVYYHERTAPIRVAHSEALMFDAARDALPRPYVEATGFGVWGELPAKVNRP